MTIDVGRIKADTRKSAKALEALVGEWMHQEGFLQQLPQTWDQDVDFRVEFQRRLMNSTIANQSADARSFWMKEIQDSFWSWRDNWAFCWDEVRSMTVPYMAWSIHNAPQAAYLGIEHAGIAYRSPNNKLIPTLLIKSRELGLSVAIVEAGVWKLMHAPDYGDQYFVARVLGQVEGNSSIWSSSLFGKVRRSIDYQPWWMLPVSYRQDTRKRVDVSRRIQVPERGCAIFAATSSYEDLRSKRGFRVFCDESNSIAQLGALYQAASDVAPMFLVSSITDRSTWFARAYHGEVMDTITKEEVGKKSGLLTMRVHFSDHPRFSPNTLEGIAEIADRRATKSKTQFAQEYDLNFAASDSGTIFKEFLREKHVISREDWNKEVRPYLSDAIMIDTWDFGDASSHGAYTVWLRSYYFEKTDELVIANYRSFGNETVDEVIKAISPFTRTFLSPSSPRPTYTVGDIAGHKSSKKLYGGRVRRELHTWHENLAAVGDVHVQGMMLDVEAAIALVRAKLKDKSITFGPDCARRYEGNDTHPCPVEAMEQYRRHTPPSAIDGQYVGENLKPSKGPPSHLADTIQMAAVLTWRSTAAYVEKNRLKTKKPGISYR